MNTNPIRVIAVAVICCGIPTTVDAQRQRGRSGASRFQSQPPGDLQTRAQPFDRGQGPRQRDAATAASLAGQESQALIAMIEEEKLAHDVYVALAKTSGNRVFSTIASAESQHVNALKQLAQRYQLKLPMADAPFGQFANPEFGELYRQLVATGSKSPLDAVLVGAKVEEMDIADLGDAIAGTRQADVKRVYENLQRASRNHLRAFSRAIGDQNGTYKATFLSQAEFDRIADAPHERGGPGNAGNRSQGFGRQAAMPRGRGPRGKGPGAGRGGSR